MGEGPDVVLAQWQWDWLITGTPRVPGSQQAAHLAQQVGTAEWDWLTTGTPMDPESQQAAHSAREVTAGWDWLMQAAHPAREVFGRRTPGDGLEAAHELASC